MRYITLLHDTASAVDMLFSKGPGSVFRMVQHRIDLPTGSVLRAYRVQLQFLQTIETKVPLVLCCIQ